MADQGGVIRVDASVRSQVGTGSARALRTAGLIPATIYGKGRDPVSVSLSCKDFLKQCRSLSLFACLVELHVDSKKEYVLTKNIQKHPVSGQVMHVDFQFVDPNANIKVEVPVLLSNSHKCIGVKLGGVLNVLHRTLSLMCSPTAIPQNVEIDLEHLGIGHSIHVSDLGLPDEIKVAMKEDDPAIVTISTAGSDIVVSDSNQEGAQTTEETK